MHNESVLVLDMQPIDPPVGGGRLRLLGLYHNLGYQTTYVGTYDWPGEKFRDHHLSKTLREIDVPLSNAHFAESDRIKEFLSGKTVIDTTFHQLAYLSPEYIEFARRETKKADVVIFSHPWVYPMVKEYLNSSHKLIIYDSQNVEGYLRYTLLDDGEKGTEIVNEVIRLEYELCHSADHILVCSIEDADMFHRLYGVQHTKMQLMPNGVFTDQIKPYAHDKTRLKRDLGLGDFIVAIFLGSNYAPNVEACNFIIQELAPQLPEILFVIAGGVSDSIKQISENVRNVIAIGSIDESEKLKYLAASDFAINPMSSGSGTNIKMFDFMAAGLPVVTTSLGARGITENSCAGIIVSDRLNFVDDIRNIARNPDRLKALGNANRVEVERKYSWEKISPELGRFISQSLSKKKMDLLFPKSVDGQYRMGLMTTWNIKCGIAEYSKYLANALSSLNVGLIILSNYNPDICDNSPDDRSENYVCQLWKYDNVNYNHSVIDSRGIIQKLQRENIRILNIQYHIGFFDEKSLVEFVARCCAENIRVIVTLHNSNLIYHDTLRLLNSEGVHFFVHTEREKGLLIDAGITNTTDITHGIIDLPDQDIRESRALLRISGNPVIGSFGFLRPHKGVLELIEAVGILRDRLPNILLFGLHALYPSEDSKQYLDACTKKIEELQLQNNVILKTDFMDIESIITHLHAADAIVLPYYDSDEGSSAAAHMAIAARRPLITSHSPIFHDIKDICCQVDSVEPKFLAESLSTLLSQNAVMDDLKQKTVKYAYDHSWRKIAEGYMAYLKGDNLGGYYETKNTILDVVDYESFDYDAQTTAVMKCILSKNSNCVDVGCHAGVFLDVVLNLAPNGTHLGFEPIPDLYRNLKEKYAVYADVSIYNYALSDSSGEASFQHVVTNKGYSGLKKRTYSGLNDTIEEIRVTTQRLDDIVPKDLPINFIKIDVEGAELQVLRGAVQTIRKYKPVIVFEHGLGAADHYGTKPEDVYELLTIQCGVRISLMQDWLKGGNTLSRAEFVEQFTQGKNYYFMAHP